jgi:hypothetical protein
MIRRMSSRVQVDQELQEEILDLDANARREIGDFLLSLQEDPLPSERQALSRRLSAAAYYVQLPSGFYVSWEMVGNLLPLALTGKVDGLLVRILGVDRDRPRSLKITPFLRTCILISFRFSMDIEGIPIGAGDGFCNATRAAWRGRA